MHRFLYSIIIVIPYSQLSINGSDKYHCFARRIGPLKYNIIEGPLEKTHLRFSRVPKPVFKCALELASVLSLH